MASRNLTDDFAALRADMRRSRDPSHPRSRSGTTGLLEDVSLHGTTSNPMADTAASPTMVKNMLPPAWVDSVESVERDLSDIDAKIESLREMHRKRLMVTFDTDEAAQDAEIEGVARGITGVFRRAEKALKKIGDATAFSGSAASGPEQKLRANIVRTLASRLQQCSVNFRRCQKDFLSRRAEQKGGAAGGFDFLSTGGGAEEAKGGGGSSKMPSLLPGLDGPQAVEGMSMEQLEAVEDIEATVAQRDHEINTIVESIEELSQIFKELAVLVIDQGTILDRIDYNMEQVVEKVEDGVVELRKAEEYQKSARPRYCICMLMFLIAIFMTLLVLKHMPRKEKHRHNCDDDDDEVEHNCDDDRYDDVHNPRPTDDFDDDYTAPVINSGARFLRGAVNALLN